MIHLRLLLTDPALALCVACTASGNAPAGTGPSSGAPAAPAPAPTATAAPAKAPLAPAKAGASVEAEYERKLDNRCNDILHALALTDTAKAAAVKEILLNHYRALHSWQSSNDKRLEELKKASHAPDATAATAAKAELETLLGTRKELRTAFLAALAKQLTPDQVTLIKDKMTYGKVKLTYTVYCAQNPWFTEEHKAKVLAWLVEAREEAIDGGSSEEKSDIFNKFKGRINNYISKQKPAK